MLAFIIYLSVVTIILLCVLSESFRKMIAKIIFGSLAVALLIYAGFALQDAARAEELPEGFYQKVVFIDDIQEEREEEEVHLYVDDLNHIWTYWESIEEDFEDLDWDKEVLALMFIRENQLEAVIDTDCCIERGRIIVLTMWECDPDNPFDEEIVDVYYTGFLTW